MLYSLDTETDGLDLHHYCKPFFVTFCDENQEVTYYEWEVNPRNRQPLIPDEDVAEIQELIDTAEGLVLQNSDFDMRALSTIGIDVSNVWDRVWDTLLAGHLLESSEPHNLAAMALKYLKIDIKKYEEDLNETVNAARRFAKSNYPLWKQAKKGNPKLPSASGSKLWPFDMWLPRAIILKIINTKNFEILPDHPKLPPRDTLPDIELARMHPWLTTLREYSNIDSAVTLPLWIVQKRLMEEQGLWNIYLERRKLLPIVFQMENTGITLSKQRMDTLVKDYKEESNRLGNVCVNIAKDFGAELVLPKAGNNKSLTEAVFNHMKLPIVKVSSKTQAPSLDKEAMETYLATLPPRSKQLAFVNALSNKRKRDTALNYMESYRRFWKPIIEEEGVYVLHPSLNPTGTATLRWSSSSPNEQNISKKEGFNIRYCFGPAPDREWWSLDYDNLELRIPAYEAGETEMINLFENPDKEPYFGSYHLLVCHILHPDKWKEYPGPAFKKKYSSTWYQWTKNGDFAVQYGALEQSGTADRAYHVPGAQARIMSRFENIDLLNKKMIKIANRTGYVWTIPDKEVDPKIGYPVKCTRDNYGRVRPTVPLNYHVQSTACWIMMRAMIKIQEYLQELNRKSKRKYYMIMNVHDEVVLDFPKKPDRGNLPKVQEVQRIMASLGDCVGVPLTAGIDYHPDNWSEGVSI